MIELDLMLENTFGPKVFLNDTFNSLNISDYEKSIDEIKGEYFRHPHTKAVLQYGGVSSPGISDLDIVVLVGDGKLTGLPRLRYSKLGKTSRFALKHPALIIPWRLYQKYWLWDIYPPRLIGGESPKTTDPPAELRVDLLQELALDRTFLIYPRHLLRLLGRKSPSARDSLSCLYGMGHTANLLKLAGQQVPKQCEQLHKGIEDLRNRWFDVGDKIKQSELNVLLRDGVIASFYLVEAVNRWVEHGGRKSTSSEGKFVDYDFLTAFSSDWTPETAILDACRFYRRTGVIGMNLPTLHMVRLLTFGRHKGVLGNYVAKNLIAPSEGTPPLSKICEERAIFLNDHMEWLVQNGYRHGDSLSGNENALPGGLKGRSRSFVKRTILGGLVQSSLKRRKDSPLGVLASRAHRQIKTAIEFRR